MTTPRLIILISLAVAAVLATVYARLYVHILQQYGYKNKNLIKWCAKNFSTYLIAPLGMFVVVGGCSIGMIVGAADDIITAGFAAAGAIAIIFLIVTGKIANAKHPLDITKRVKRLFIAIFLLYAAALALAFIFVQQSAYFTAILCALPVAAPLIVCTANLLCAPMEAAIRNWYFNDAMQKLAQHKDIIKIGITGSYGKTSVKFILSEILSVKYDVLTPPQSYNTPMGLTRVIRENLKDQQVFVAEMGARKHGDIAELCRLVSPKMGIITSVGPQHIETFKSVENVAATKYELVEALPADGVAFFNADDEHCLQLYKKTSKEKVLYGIDSTEDLYACASGIKTGIFGSEFWLKFADEKEAISVATKLLGKHNILNITGAAGIAKKLGMNTHQIAEGIAALTPVEHRLCLIPTGNGINVIDDAFNSNAAGAAAAMDVLSAFPGRHIVITPGMVELGAMEQELHEQFGKNIAEAAHIIILVGEERTKSIYEGIRKADFEMNKVYVVHSLSEATALFARISKVGDTVIFENDLPDSLS